MRYFRPYFEMSDPGLLVRSSWRTASMAQFELLGLSATNRGWQQLLVVLLYSMRVLVFERFRRHRACASQHFRLELKARGSWLASPASWMLVFARRAFLVHFLVVIGRWRFGCRRETAARLCRSWWWRPVDQRSLVQLHSPVPISYQGCG